MTRTALVLGPGGRFGRNAAEAFGAAGWAVRHFDRRGASLSEAARGAAVIVNGWNPPYHRWAADVPGLTRQVIAAGEASGALVIVPGNVYPFGADAPEVLTAALSHGAANPLGRVRMAMEAAYRASGARVLILRAGDFIDSEPSGGWFDRVLTKELRRGRFRYPGPLDRLHAWAYLPDLARAAVMLAERAGGLGRFTDLPFPGYSLSGAQMQATLERCLGRPLQARRLNWLPVRALACVMPAWRGVVEMSYLWRKPHALDGSVFRALLPEFRDTPPEVALASAIRHQIGPDQPMAGGGARREERRSR